MCMFDYIDQINQNANFDGNLKCPCGDPSTFRNIKWKYQCKLVRTQSKVECIQNELEFIRENICTLKCPHCNIAFVDFEGCCAIQCSCSKFFCALCLQGFDTDKDCHDHVLMCNHGNYYMSTAYWPVFISKYKLKKLFVHLNTIYWKTYSVLYVLGLFSITVGYIVDLPSMIVYLRFMKYRSKAIALFVVCASSYPTFQFLSQYLPDKYLLPP